MDNNIQSISSAIHVIANAVNNKTKLVYHLGNDNNNGVKTLNGKNIYIIYDNIDPDKKEKIGKFIEEALND